jgi:hypothetical protein
MMKRMTLAVGLTALLTPFLIGEAQAAEGEPARPVEGVFDTEESATESITEISQDSTATMTADTPVELAVTPAPMSPDLITDGNLSEGDLTDSDLADLRGGAAVVIGTQTLIAISTGSVLNGNFTAGAVSLTDNAFSNFNGFGNLVINTGALNNLQSGMNVTINFAN